MYRSLFSWCILLNICTSLTPATAPPNTIATPPPHAQAQPATAGRVPELQNEKLGTGQSVSVPKTQYARAIIDRDSTQVTFKPKNSGPPKIVSCEEQKGLTIFVISSEDQPTWLVTCEKAALPGSHSSPTTNMQD